MHRGKDGEKFGIVKIIPPDGWNPPPTDIKCHNLKVMATTKQAVHLLMKVGIEHMLNTHMLNTHFYQKVHGLLRCGHDLEVVTLGCPSVEGSTRGVE